MTSSRILTAVLTAAAVVLGIAVANAQDVNRYRGARTLVKGGMLEKPDTLKNGARPDTLQYDSLATAVRDSLYVPAADSLAGILPDSLLSTVPPTTDSLPLLSADSIRRDSTVTAESVVRRRNRRNPDRRPFISDSMPISNVCWMSLVLPGFGQIYNKQYWKLPILYSTVGASLGMFIYENNRYTPLKKRFDAMTDRSLYRTPEMDALQTKLIRSNTRRQLYLVASIASYIYFIGDAAVCYATNDVSDIKKATTLSTICPGAGQIYNKSYWRVPFVVGGLASTIYCIDWNNRGYQRFKKAYSLKTAYDKNPENYPNGSPDEFSGRYSSSFLKNLKDSYRRNRDLCIIITAGIYVLQIVDAHVDAHLKDYDISDDLSLDIQPMITYDYLPTERTGHPSFGMNLTLKF